MKKYIYLIPIAALVFNSCMKDKNLPDPVMIEPNYYEVVMKLDEYKNSGEQWTPALSGDTMRFNWSLVPPVTGEPLRSHFGPGSFSNPSDSPIIGIGKSGNFYAKGEQVYFTTYNTVTKESILIDSGKYWLDGDYFYLKKKEVEIKFRMPKIPYTP